MRIVRGSRQPSLRGCQLLFVDNARMAPRHVSRESRQGDRDSGTGIAGLVKQTAAASAVHLWAQHRSLERHKTMVARSSAGSRSHTEPRVPPAERPEMYRSRGHLKHAIGPCPWPWQLALGRCAKRENKFSPQGPRRTHNREHLSDLSPASYFSLAVKQTPHPFLSAAPPANSCSEGQYATSHQD
jgi:hypothetical protein